MHKNGKGFSKDGQTLIEKETEDENKDDEYLFYISLYILYIGYNKLIDLFYSSATSPTNLCS